MEKQKQQTSHEQDSFMGMVNFGKDAMHFAASVWSAPFEMALRRRIGSRYMHPVVLMFAAFIPPAMWAVLGMAAKFLGGSEGLIGMGTVCFVLWALQWIHSFHVLNVFMHPEKEELSYEDGKPAPFWKLLPKGDKWAMQRFVYEPGLVLCLGLILPLMGILTRTAGLYFVIGAGALFLKALFLYWRAWEHLRDILDEFGLTKKMAGASGRISNAESVQAALRAPMGVPMAACVAVQETAKEALPAELQSLLSESKETPEAEGKSVEQGVADLLTPAKGGE